jgi:hypothetical protein
VLFAPPSVRPVEASPHDLVAATTMVLPHLKRGPAPILRAAPARPARRPAILVPLYGSFAGLQALDAHSTRQALDRGHREANPLMEPATRRNTTMIGVKVVATLGTVLAVERLWRKSRVAAVLTMIGVNAGYAAVVASNYRRARDGN